MDVFFENDIKEYFGFLVSEHNFSYPIFYDLAYEDHAAYIKDDFYVNIAFDGTYRVTIEKYRKVAQDVLSEKTKMKDLDYRKRRIYFLSRLDSKKELYHSIQHLTGHEKDLFYYATLLKNNPKILNGDFRIFSLWYFILKKIQTSRLINKFLN